MHITIKPKNQQEQFQKTLQKAKNISLTSSNCIAMQIKNHMETRPREYHEQTQKKKYIINKILANAQIETHKTIRK